MPANVAEKFSRYPLKPRQSLKSIRALIFDIAQQEKLAEPEESLKWGEPSYLVKGGSPVRFNWSDKDPQHYSLYFNCKTTLVETFKEIYGDVFEFKANRSIRFALKDSVPEKELRHCLLLAFRYHHLKHMPLLGA